MRVPVAGIAERADVELKRPKRDEVTTGADVILKCDSTGNPDPTILWYHNKFRSVSWLLSALTSLSNTALHSATASRTCI